MFIPGDVHKFLLINNEYCLNQHSETRTLLVGVNKVLFFVCILLGISPASDYGLPTFRNTLSVPSSKAGCEVRSAFIVDLDEIWLYVM